MDSDCLVKLTKAGAKEIVAVAMEIHIPYLVKKETVDDVKDRSYPDALVIEENIKRKVLHLRRYKGKSSAAISMTKGEEEVVSLYLGGGYEAVASDDRRFLKKLQVAGIPYLTSSACVLYLFINERIKKTAVIEILKGLSPFISKEEYDISKFYLEGKE